MRVELTLVGLPVDKKNYTGEFESHLSPNSYDMAPNLTKKPWKLSNVLRQKQQSGNTLVSKNEMNNS